MPGKSVYSAAVGAGSACPGGLSNFGGFCCPVPKCPQGALYIGGEIKADFNRKIN